MTDDLFRHVAALLATDYLIEAEIGRGGMAVVYRGIERHQGRRVAIKVLPPQLAFNPTVRERFLREARIAAALDHTGIVPIYMAANTGDIAYFVMRLVEGESLAQRLAREQMLSIDDTRLVLSSVADALDFAHAAGVVHRDVKPDNIMLEAATGRAVVTDFGIARTWQGDATLTDTGATVGTPSYMSPEQAIGERPVDARSDVYSLGVMGYQMIAGELPFSANNTPALLAKIVSETPRQLRALRPETPESLANTIAVAMAKNAGERWPSAAAFRDAVGDVSGMVMTPSAGPSLRSGRQMEAGPSLRSGRLSPEMEKRLGRFRHKALDSLGLIAASAILNVMETPDTYWTLLIAGLLGFDLVLAGQRLWGDGVPFAEIVGWKRPRRIESCEVPEVATSIQPPPEATPHAIAVTEIGIDFAAIQTLLARLTDAERSMIPDVRAVVESLFASVKAIPPDYIDLDPEMLSAISGGAGSLPGVANHLDEAASAMLSLRLDLTRLIANRFESGLHEVITSRERIRALSNLRDD
jgi:serine/threonine protein kinase